MGEGKKARRGGGVWGWASPPQATRGCAARCRGFAAFACARETQQYRQLRRLSSERKLRKNAPCLNQLAISNFALYVNLFIYLFIYLFVPGNFDDQVEVDVVKLKVG